MLDHFTFIPTSFICGSNFSISLLTLVTFSVVCMGVWMCVFYCHFGSIKWYLLVSWSTIPSWLMMAGLIIIINLFKRQQGKDRQLVHYPNAVNSWDWSRQKPRAQNSHGWQGRRYLGHHLLPPKVFISRKLESGAWTWLGFPVWYLCVQSSLLTTAPNAHST